MIEAENEISTEGSFSIYLPDLPLSRRSVSITTGKKVADWTEEEHSESYHLLRTLIDIFRLHHNCSDYLIYGTEEKKDFSWQIVPFQKMFILL